MQVKNKVEVVICGKMLTVVGVESEEYMQQVARYIDKKMNAVLTSDSGLSLSHELVSLLTSVNVADDLFKERKITEDLTEKVEELNETIRQKDAQMEKLQIEVGRMQAEYSAIREKLMEMQLEFTYYKQKYYESNEELLKSKKDLEEYINNFDK